MLKRKIEQTLFRWKQHKGHKPLVIKGCRQCGKTSSVLKFARENYKHVVYLNFQEHREYRSIFKGSLDVATLIFNITIVLPKARFIQGETCLILDEIQECPAARASLKFFKLDGRYDVICTGSLLGVSGYSGAHDTDNTSIPVGYEQIITMYPMDFEEWLWANGIEDKHIEYLRECLASRTPVNDIVHERMRQLLLRYTIVGGMPDAINTFFETDDFNEVVDIQRGIVNEYRDDMIKYAASTDKSRIRECFNSIPAQLARENKKFSYAIITKGARSRDYRGSLQWIEDAGIIRRCYNTLSTELPLEGNVLGDSFKVYMSDIGLLISMLDDGTLWNILQGETLTYKGAIFENLVADILGKKGRKLYYFRKDSGLEIDFLIHLDGECVPLECKASTGNAKSLKTVLNHPEHYHVNRAVKVGDYNIGQSDKILTIPFYLLFLL